MVVEVQHLHVSYLLIFFAVVYISCMWLDFCNFCFAIFSSLLIFILRIVHGQKLHAFITNS